LKQNSFIYLQIFQDGGNRKISQGSFLDLRREPSVYLEKGRSEGDLEEPSFCQGTSIECKFRQKEAKLPSLHQGGVQGRSIESTLSPVAF
jgi:hypothetical protein